MQIAETQKENMNTTENKQRLFGARKNIQMIKKHKETLKNLN